MQTISKLRLGIALATFLCLSGCRRHGGADRSSVDIPRDVAVLPPSAATEVLAQCSRQTLQSVTGFWQPSEKDVADAEAALAAFFPQGRFLSGYKRQYVGALVNGRKVIYINSFHGSVAEEMKTNWRKTPVNVCDGGDAFWGCEYDPATKAVTNVMFNGEA